MDAVPAPDRQGLDPDDQFDRNRTELGAKRRKLRKGTRSCWECKRRKIKCTFASEAHATCITCRRRGIKCVGQEFPEDQSEAEESHGSVHDRITGVEALLGQLLKQLGQDVAEDESPSNVDGDDQYPSGVCQTSSETATIVAETSHQFSPVDQTIPESQCQIANHSLLLPHPECDTPMPTVAACRPRAQHQQISQELLAAFPLQEDIEKLCRTNFGSIYYSHLINTRSKVHRKCPHNATESVEKLTEMPGPDTHPVLLARRMLILALYLQHQGKSLQQLSGLSEHPRTLMQRLADTAIRLVTTDEGLLGDVESLECIVFEGIYQANYGNLRRAWLAFRRAIMVAQLMSLHKPGSPPAKTIDPGNKVDLKFLWFRVVYMDRFVSLMIGLPHATLDLDLETDIVLSSSTPAGRFERTHAIIAGLILKRNEHDPSLRDYDATLDIDAQLLEAAKSLPSKFWLPPDFTGSDGTARDVFWESMRLVDHFVHFYLLIQLHLPYLLRHDADRSFDYSQLTAVSASREILTRFMALRVYNPSLHCCLLSDFFALMAAMTLLLSHLDSHHHLGSHNFLAHQRLGDRAMTEQVLERMENVSRTNEDALTARSAELLRNMLAFEHDVAQGQRFSTENLESATGDHQDDERKNKSLHIFIPYFGVIRITRKGTITKVPPPRLHTQTPVHARQHDYDHQHEFPANTGSVHVANHIYSFGLGEPTPEFRSASSNQQSSSSRLGDTPGAFNEQDDHGNMEECLSPGLVAGTEDWAFQGVDTVFFDSLMKGVYESGW